MLLISALIAAGALAASPQQNAELVLNWCDASSLFQQYTVGPSSVTTPDGALCATMSSPFPAPLTLQPCVPGLATQAWTFNSSAAWPLAFTAPNATGDGQCLLWNTQGGPGYERVGSTVGVYACSAPTPFDSVFAPGSPSPGLLAASYTSPNNSTFSNLCVEARNPSPPPIGTPQIIDWQLSEFACFVHFNMATAVGSQGCQGCNGGAPPNISDWHPENLNTDAWIDAGVAMGCKRFIYVAKHGCGFCTWPSKAQILGSTYPYSVAFAPNKTDVVSAFVASAKKRGVGYGFYYSVGSNALCNACGGGVQPNPAKGQLSVTQEEFDALVIQQLTELWTIGPKIKTMV